MTKHQYSRSQPEMWGGQRFSAHRLDAMALISHGYKMRTHPTGLSVTSNASHSMSISRGANAQKRAKQEFLSSLETAYRIYAPAREMCIFNYDSFEGSIYHPNVAAKIVGLAFLSAVSAWEDYLAHAYLGYLSGYPAPNGYLPGLQCGKALNKSHALLLASGECNLREAERKMRWNSFRWVKALSKIHFKANNPFEQISEADIRWLEIAVTIRNRVAHNSDKAKSQFKEVVNRIFGEPKNAALPRGFSPGQLLIVLLEPFPQLHLLNSDEHHWGDIFEGYMSLWSRLADEICPGP